MTDQNYLRDFEKFLGNDFNASRICSELLKTSNVDSESTELDLVTSIKKIRYSIDDVDQRTEDAIRANPLQLIDSFDKRNLTQSTTRESLSSSFEYLNISYKRLDKDILEPYEDCLHLQSALSKIHQTASILRDVLIFLHLLSQISSGESLSSHDRSLDQNMLALASLHSQIQVELDSNPNLRALTLVKKHETEIIVPSRHETLRVMSEKLIKDCAGKITSQSELQDVGQYLFALRKISQKDFIGTVDKIVLSRVSYSTQALSKTITSIRNFPIILKEIIQEARSISFFEETLRATTIDNLSLLSEYLSHKKYNSLTELFWVRIAKSFKRDFEISYNRGGPVGKSLASNSSMIRQSIVHAGDGQGVGDRSFDVDKMLDSISILSAQSSK
ncbi:LANO_0H07206g1_1 [Lachancea nothofagi CBS 11611]|uniref:Conserved oligomeric Golgi complex subunit 5 n=1 Tax=Lachancea nothofagi CBS 11611 TaxID=1266666 RepID=A0A1G4KLI2_9SACH|nr:LANO_0H07206g1_1 [Lachancea nothofagi CBS 11611]